MSYRYSAECFNCFPGAADYPRCSPDNGAVREDGPRPDFFHSEMHVQGLWADAHWRPDTLPAASGETVTVLEPGRWNREKGPDFIDTVVRTEDNRVIRGDTEVHVHAHDWIHHGHADDPAYARVRFHVTWHAGALPEHHLPPGALQIALQPVMDENPLFSFDHIDIESGADESRYRATPCFSVCEKWPPEQKTALLDAAGQERLRRKAANMRRRMERCDPEQLLYEHLARSLGYKHNRIPFHRLAARLPVNTLRRSAGLDPMRAYAALMGAAGLLPDPTQINGDDETRAFLRRAWDHWWTLRFAVPERLASADWNLSNVRPANHPRRRMMALARLFTRAEPLSRSWAKRLLEPEPLNAQTWLDDFSSVSCPYWDYRFSFSAPRRNTASALIGHSRATGIVINVLIPFLAACSHAEDEAARLLQTLPDEAHNRITRRMALRLLGRDYPPSLLRRGLRKQGLIQIYYDYCLASRTGCADCALPEILRASTRPCPC